jgi:superoxide dismutase, Cu-Zn family
MAKNKWMAALCVGSFVSVMMLTLQSQAAPEQTHSGNVVSKAEAQLIPTTKTESKVKGTIYFEKTSHGVHVHGEVTGLTPGEHGFHVHEFGVWSPDGMATGGHFNPAGAAHAGHDSPKRHVGDLGNIKADERGKAVIDLEDNELSFEGANCILGRGLVVHAKADDLKSQPAGAAGDRLAVAIIGVARP